MVVPARLFPVCVWARRISVHSPMIQLPTIMDFAQEAGISFFNMANRLDEISPGHKTAPKDYTW